MKIRNLALMAALPAAIMVANTALADDGPTVYGQLDLSLQKHDAEHGGTPEVDNWNFSSNASRFGIKGSSDLNDNMKGIYKIEFQVMADTGDNSTFSGTGGSSSELRQRNIYAGVQGNWGTAIGGKFDTPLKESQGKVDQFNDYFLGDIKRIMPGENRASNIIMYSSPKIANNITVNVAVMPGEQDGVNPGQSNNRVNDGNSISVVYDTETLYLAAAMDNDVYNDESGSFVDIYRLTGQVKMGDLVLGAIVQQADGSSNNDDAFMFTSNNGSHGAGVPELDSEMVSAAYTMGDNTFKAQYGIGRGQIASTADAHVEQWSLGLDHKLGKNATAYGYYTSYYDDEGKTYGDKYHETAFGVGLRLKF